MAFQIKNLSIVLLNNDCEPGWLLHATTSELHLNGSIVHNLKTLLVSANFLDVQCKILRHYKQNQKSTRPCLAEINLGLALDGTLKAHGPISIEVCYIFTIHFLYEQN